MLGLLQYHYITFCSRGFIPWLQKHLIPCPFKYLTGLDCPGCGFQRALIFLLKGEFHKSFIQYPPTIPLLIFFTFMLVESQLKFDKKDLLKKALFIITGYIVIISFGIKIMHGHLA